MDSIQVITDLLTDDTDRQSTRYFMLYQAEREALSEAIEVMQRVDEMCAAHEKRFPAKVGSY